ncbi:MAG: hypothetical protein MHM6MM_002222 [Cercozoa sp. M6MM]
MGRSKGYRAQTRDKFSKKTKGLPAPAKQLTVFKVGDIVDIKVDPSVHKGMPHHFYHGRTGRVWNISPRSVGVVVQKQVNGRFILKKLSIRSEHVQHSASRKGFLARVQENDEKRRAYQQALAKGEKVEKPLLKRLPVAPAAGFTVRAKKVISVAPLPFEFAFV